MVASICEIWNTWVQMFYMPICIDWLYSILPPVNSSAILFCRLTERSYSDS